MYLFDFYFTNTNVCLYLISDFYLEPVILRWGWEKGKIAYCPCTVAGCRSWAGCSCWRSSLPAGRTRWSRACRRTRTGSTGRSPGWGGLPSRRLQTHNKHNLGKKKQTKIIHFASGYSIWIDTNLVIFETTIKTSKKKEYDWIIIRNVYLEIQRLFR